MQNREEVKFYPETQIYRYSFSRYDVMAYKRKWRCSPATLIAGKKLRTLFVIRGLKLPNFDLLIISLPAVKDFLLNHIDLQLTLMKSHLDELMIVAMETMTKIMLVSSKM